jgi:Ca-activated chloride channel family protein
MNLTSEFGQTENWFIALFFILYLIYLGRIFWIARKLKTTARSSVLKFVLRSVYFSLMLLALLNPSFGELSGTIKSQGRDIFLLIDVSKSMDATDIQPSRIEKAKFEVSRFINHFQTDRIGLIVFSEETFTLSPLTFDRNAISLFIPQINTDLLPEGGTNFMPTLALALEKLEKSKSNNKSKVIVLISDGENFGNYDQAIVDKIRKKGINLFTVGIGTANGITLRAGKGFKKDSDGNIVVTKLNSELLKKLVHHSPDKYLEINNISDSFSDLITQVEQITSNLIDEQQVNVISNKYFYFLIIALFLLVIDAFFTVRTFQL